VASLNDKQFLRLTTPVRHNTRDGTRDYSRTTLAIVQCWLPGEVTRAGVVPDETRGQRLRHRRVNPNPLQIVVIFGRNDGLRSTLSV